MESEKKRYEIGPLDAGPIAPIDVEPSETERQLGRLEAAPPEADALARQDYRSVIQVLAKEHPSLDQANNLGYAYAWLGYQQNDYSLWAKALSVLQTAEQQAEPPEQHDRVARNLDRVRAALNAWAAE
jgi:hypothetical protein